MRMAEIMDTKKDDLALKDKIKQVRNSKMIVWLFSRYCSFEFYLSIYCLLKLK